MFKVISGLDHVEEVALQMPGSKATIEPGTLSDGKKTVRLFVAIPLGDKILRAAVIPPKGTSDGFHEALDTIDLTQALDNTRNLWTMLENEIATNNDLLLRPEELCEMVDKWGGWQIFGAQAALSAREVVFKLSAQYEGISLEEAKHKAYKRVGGLNDMAFAIPQSVMLSAAKHGNGIIEWDESTYADSPWDASVSKTVQGLPWQEWMVQLAFAKTPEELIDAGQQFHDILYWLLADKGDPVQELSKEGGMTVNNIKTPYEIVALYKEAVEILGQRLGSKEKPLDLQLGRDITLAIDGACTENYFPDRYIYSGIAVDSEELQILQSVPNIGSITFEDVLEGKIALTREQHYRYTEFIRAKQKTGDKIQIMDFYTEGTYHTVLSDSEAEIFQNYLAKNDYSQPYAALKKLEDTELAQSGYKKFALTYQQQALLMRHIIDTTGNVFSSIEDLMHEDDWNGWKFSNDLIHDVQLVGDDFWVTNPARMVRAYREGIFNAVPLIKENQVADPWKSILMISLSEQVQYLKANQQIDFVINVIRQEKYDDMNSVHTIKELITELHEKVQEIGLPTEPVIAAVASHRSKSSFSPDVDLTLGLATGSTGKIGAIGSPALIAEWEIQINPVEASLATRTEKYRWAERAVRNHANPTMFNQNSVPGLR